MKNIKFGCALLALLLCKIVNAASYTAPNIDFPHSNPKYVPSRESEAQDSYHMSGVTWDTDRAIASEVDPNSDRGPSSLEKPVVTPPEDKSYEPKTWSYKQ